MACVRIKYPLKYPLCPSKFPLKLNAHSDSTDQAPTKHRSTTDQAQEIILSMSEYYMTMNEIMTSMRLKHPPYVIPRKILSSCIRGRSD